MDAIHDHLNSNEITENLGRYINKITKSTVQLTLTRQKKTYRSNLNDYHRKSKYYIGIGIGILRKSKYYIGSTTV